MPCLASASSIRALALWALLPALLTAADPLDAVQTSALEWARVRAETVRLESEWQTEAQLLTASQDVLRERLRLLQEKKEDLLRRTTTERAEIDTFTAKNDASRNELAAVAVRLDELTAQLESLRPSLPPRLSVALELPFRSLTDAQLSVNERMQHALALLNRSLQFNRVLTYSEEPVSLGANDTRLLQVLYWGLSHAFAFDPASHHAFVGRPLHGRWAWDRLPDGDHPVGTLMAIYQEKADPAYVATPLQLPLSSP
jgi:Protein of unknown function (DUF3450)